MGRGGEGETMKNLWIVCVIAVAAAGLLCAAEKPLAPAKLANGWELAWSDEFDKDGLPDPAKWGYEVGYIRNGEKQYYTESRKENARVEKGFLIIEGRKEQYAIPKGGGKIAEYTSANLLTRNTASWTYGRLEMRAKLPHGKGVWPAFWTLGTAIDKHGWPACGEIDIMEFVGHTPDKVHGTVHWSQNGKHAQKGTSLAASKPWEDFHVYAAEWTPERIDLFYDGQKYFTFNVADADDKGSNSFRQPHFILLNLALGGSWGGKIDDSIFPQQFVVDYVRVYQPKGPPAAGR